MFNWYLLKQSKNALSTFTSLKDKLDKINIKIEKAIEKTIEKEKKIAEKRSTLAAIVNQHKNVMNNISKFLGESDKKLLDKKKTK